MLDPTDILSVICPERHVLTVLAESQHPCTQRICRGVNGAHWQQGLRHEHRLQLMESTLRHQAVLSNCAEVNAERLSVALQGGVWLSCLRLLRPHWQR